MSRQVRRRRRAAPLRRGPQPTRRPSRECLTDRGIPNRRYGGAESPRERRRRPRARSRTASVRTKPIESSAAARLLGVRARAVSLDSEDSATQIVQGVPQTGVCQLVTHASPNGHGDDEAAVAQTGKMIRQPGTGDLQLIGQIGWMCGSLTESQQDATTNRLGERATEPGQRVDVRGNGQHLLKVQDILDSGESESSSDRDVRGAREPRFLR